MHTPGTGAEYKAAHEQLSIAVCQPKAFMVMYLRFRAL